MDEKRNKKIIYFPVIRFQGPFEELVFFEDKAVGWPKHWHSYRLFVDKYTVHSWASLLL